MKLIISFLFVFIIFSTLVNSEMDPEEEAIVKRLMARSQYKPALKGKSNQDPPERKKLPVNWADPDVAHKLEGKCDITLNVADTYIKFQLDSQDKPCRYDFMGSVEVGCTVCIVCHEVVAFKPPKSYGSPESCVDEYFRLSDGTTGNMTGCGNFVFNKIPRYARNGGKDLYLVYKGKSPNSPCVAFCKEDLDDSYKDILAPKPLARYRKFRGFPVPEDSPSCECGKRNNQQGRIVGGEKAKRFEFPWLGGLIYYKELEKELPSRRRLPFCGGALISDKHVLTAAHCLTNPNMTYQVLFHAHVMDRAPNLTHAPLTAEDIEGIESWDIPLETDETEQSVRVEVESYINHPLFNNDTTAYDVALLTLKQRVSFADRRVLPICLPDMKELLEFKKGETTFTVAGWGLQKENQKVIPRLLQKLDGLPYVTQKNCELFASAPYTHMCVGFLNKGGKSSCQGDSGGPLAYKINAEKNQYVVVGVVSAAVGCGGPQDPATFTKVQEVLQWIYYTTANTDAFWCRR